MDGPSTSSASAVKREFKEEVDLPNAPEQKVKKEKTKKSKKERKHRKRHYSTTSEEASGGEKDDDEQEKKPEPIDQEQLLEDMREEHNLKFKSGILSELRAEDRIKVNIHSAIN
jgi:hypothetical protein